MKIIPSQLPVSFKKGLVIVLYSPAILEHYNANDYVMPVSLVKFDKK